MFKKWIIGPLKAIIFLIDIKSYLLQITKKQSSSNVQTKILWLTNPLLKNYKLISHVQNPAKSLQSVNNLRLKLTAAKRKAAKGEQEEAAEEEDEMLHLLLLTEKLTWKANT